jgi:hypothetical protein
VKYRSKVLEIEAMQWLDPNPDDNPENGATIADSALLIVQWVNSNGGEAEYLTECRAHGLTQCHYPGCPSPCPVILLRTINGWAPAYPDHYVMKGSTEFVVCEHGHQGQEVAGKCKNVKQVLDFYPCDPQTFDRRWEPA